MNNVWEAIYDHYGINVSSESLLNYVAINLIDGETYRQFYDRLLSHARLHLPPANLVVDGINTGPTGEAMTVGMMNFIAMDWLRKINPHLISIIQTEYSRELRENVQLSSLVPRIANNIDAMLNRHDIVGGTESLNLSDSVTEQVHRIKHGHASARGRDKNFKNANKVNRNRPFCPECHYLSRKLKLDINFSHLPVNCPRPKAAVNLLLADEAAHVATDEENTSELGKDLHKFDNDKSYYYQKNSNDSISEVAHDSNFTRISEPFNKPESSPDILYQQVLSLRHYSSDTVRKEYSPQLRTQIGTVIADSIVDEGSELNCICDAVASRCGIQYNPITIKAMSAGSNPMKLLGVVPYNIKLKVQNTNSDIEIVLKRAVVIKNLGPNVLIGEPGKVDNDIITFPKQRLIQLTDVSGRKIKIPYHSHTGKPSLNHHPYSVKRTTIIYPQEIFHIPIPPSMQCNAINVTMRRGFSLDPVIQNGKKTFVQLQNTSQELMFMPKHAHIADLLTCEEFEGEQATSNVMKIVDIVDEDALQFKSPPSLLEDTLSYVHEINIDPDNKMPTSWKKRFSDLCQSFSDIITPQPGRYNGAFGRVSTDINFVTQPPSNLKTYLPKYSSEMLKMLADKMDTLEHWGVLRKPEELGIIPEFIVPSMLTPKPEKGQFRLVTDFTSLNKYIKKLPVTSPTIQEAKGKIAKYKYHAFLDLSNYYYQGGVKIQDSQYLATVHPFKGVMVYTVEPQGLLNSGEHAYERLARIYGDMCANEQMTRMADGLYVLGNTYGELLENLREVFDRAKISNLTFKPSKIVICPYDVVIFGWRKCGDAWCPTDHTILPLVNAPPPVTVKQLRSWIGSYKQLSDCIKDYAIPLSRLELLTGSDKNAANKIQWTEELLNDFADAKQMIKSLEKIYTPVPDDTLHSYSDFSAEQNRRIYLAE